MAICSVRGDIITETIGSFGPWQRRTIFLLYLCKVLTCWCMAIILFTAPTQRAKTIQCYRRVTSQNGLSAMVKVNDTIDYRWDDVLHPKQQEPNDKPFDIDFCDVEDDLSDHIVANHSELDAPEPWNNSMNCDRLEHEAFIQMNRTRFHWICSRNFVASFTQLAFLVGVLTGGIIAGKVLNFVSPKNLLLIGMIGQIASGISLAFVTDYKLQMLARYFNSVSCAQMFAAGQMILSDITSPPYTQFLMPIFDSFWSIGGLTLAAMAVFIHSWQNLYLAISLPTFAYIGLWYFIADSPRWYMRRGRIGHATKIILDAAVYNEKSKIVHGDFIESLKPERFLQNVESNRSDINWFRLWTNGNFLNVLCVHLIWGTMTTNFNGMLLNSRSFGADKLHQTVAMTSSAEIVGILIAYFVLIGSKRKWLINGLMNIFFAFIVLLSVVTVADHVTAFYPWLAMVMNLTLKTLVSATMAVIVSSTGDLVSSKFRPLLIVSCTTFGRICLLTASYIGSLSLFGPLMPLIVFSTNIAIAGFCLCIINPNDDHDNEQRNNGDTNENECLTEQNRTKIVSMNAHS